MALLSKNTAHDHYFEFKTILFDTCGLSWFAGRDDCWELIEKINNLYTLLLPTVSLYELGFGPSGSVRSCEKLILEKFMDSTRKIEMREYDELYFSKKLARKFYVINPGYNEWWTAKKRLLSHVDDSESCSNKPNMRTIKEKSFDALIHATSRNCFSPICTTNIKDFRILNRQGSKLWYDGTVPFYSPEQLVASLDHDVFFED